MQGVSGCGKSTLGAGLASALRLPFVDADALHPQTNIDKMSRGESLTDADRAPWLALVRAEAVRTCRLQERDNDFLFEQKRLGNDGVGEQRIPARRGIVVGCSALKRGYREVLRGQSLHNDLTEGGEAAVGAAASDSPSYLRTFFVYIKGTRDVLLERMEHRKGHFMKASMLDGQLATLEAPDETGEPGVVVVDLEAGMEEQVRGAVEGLRQAGAEA